MVKFGELLDLIDVNRESEEIIRIMGSDGEPERKTGKWMIIDPQRQEDIDNDNYMYTCSRCLHNDLHARSQVVPYCWWCGAKMEVEE